MPIATVTQLESKSHDTPDETRTPPKTRVEQVSVGGYTLGRLTFEPGWRWSECIKPVAGTESCQLSHVGYVISGRLNVATTDGKKIELKTGESYSIPPGHDAWNDDDQPFVAMEIVSAGEYAKPSGPA
jgi:mannose-6-phosphate isomerase-like protein (cupin superfamily)